MPLVNVMVNGRAYTIACDEGEEEHLKRARRHVDAKVRELLGSVGQVGDQRLMLMAALLLADEHHDGGGAARARMQERAGRAYRQRTKRSANASSKSEAFRRRCAGSRRKADRGHCRQAGASLDWSLGQVLPRASG